MHQQSANGEIVRSIIRVMLWLSYNRVCGILRNFMAEVRPQSKGL